jgi:RluA family pseudouridine synthase
VRTDFWPDFSFSADSDAALRRHLQYPGESAAVSDAEFAFYQLLRESEGRDGPASPVRLVAPYEFTHRFSVKPDEAGMTLVDLLCMRFPFRSSEAWRQRIENGDVRVSDALTSPDHILRENASVSHRNSGVVEPSVPDDLRILYESDDVLLIDKPAPMPVHPGGRYNKNTAISVLRERGYDELFVVHRLDAVTSGVMVVARSPQVAHQLQALFIASKLHKRYEAIVAGNPPPGETVIRLGIKRLQGYIYTCSEDADAREAETRFRVVEQGNGWARVQCEPITGRTHQIRLHLQAWGYPIWDDPLYGPHAPADPFEAAKVMQNRPISLVSLRLG